MESVFNLPGGFDFKEILAEYVVSKVADEALAKLKQSFSILKSRVLNQTNESGQGLEVLATEELIIQKIKNNISEASQWSKEINLKIFPESKELKSLFVELDLYISLTSHRIGENDEIKKISSKKLLSKINNNVLLYGAPGAGKTTLMMNLYQSCLEKVKKDISYPFPFLVKFRDINYDKYQDNNFSLASFLLNMFGIDIENISYYLNSYIQLEKKKYRINNTKNGLKFLEISPDYPSNDGKNLIYIEDEIDRIISDFLDKFNVFIIFDGFDEIPDLKIKRKIEMDLVKLSSKFITSRFIITSRNEEFQMNLYNSNIFEICPLTEKQILAFIGKWIKKKQLTEDLFYKIKASPFYDTTIRPLTLAYLCAIFERNKDIPDKPRYVYDIVLNLLLEKWDQQRGITRRTQYSQLYIERMKDFLSQLSFELTFSFKKITFSDDHLAVGYRRICAYYNLPKEESKEVVRDIESHNGLIIQVGINSYQFAHKSIQEYLVAKFIVNLPEIPPHDVISNLIQETAIAVCLSSDPNRYLFFLIKYIPKISLRYWLTFLNRLNLEKPDFNNSIGALLFFFTLINEDNNTQSYQESIFDIMNKEVNNLLLNTNLKMGFDELFEYYRIDISDLVLPRVKIKIKVTVDIKSITGFPHTLLINSNLLKFSQLRT